MTNPFVRCPQCNRKQPERCPASIYRCPVCGVMFDGDPDEGGDYANDPVYSAEAKERRERRKVR